MAFLTIDNLCVRVGEKEILKDFSLTIHPGEVHVIMGPNGSGKSTLANVIAGHPAYEVTAGRILFKDKDILKMTPDERANSGIFLAFQTHRKNAIRLSLIPSRTVQPGHRDPPRTPRCTAPGRSRIPRRWPPRGPRQWGLLHIPERRRRPPPAR